MLPFDLKVSEIIFFWTAGQAAKNSWTKVSCVFQLILTKNLKQVKETVSVILQVFYSIKQKFCNSYSKINYGTKVVNFRFSLLFSGVNPHWLSLHIPKYHFIWTYVKQCLSTSGKTPLQEDYIVKQDWWIRDTTSPTFVCWDFTSNLENKLTSSKV